MKEGWGGASSVPSVQAQTALHQPALNPRFVGPSLLLLGVKGADAAAGTEAAAQVPSAQVPSAQVLWGRCAGAAPGQDAPSANSPCVGRAGNEAGSGAGGSPPAEPTSASGVRLDYC